ncbi:hypothetical protein [Hanstruepera ponticola]|uniref:hypothetical protein n=1 Tax=Hanstruepera ponticola TaxID=2042995 RepID=UPI00177ACE54|nr:hypothetical protein [Hanstruepera ponticola]
MKLNLLNFLVLIIISSLVVCCENNDDSVEENNACIEYETGYVTSVNAPDTGTINETINIEVNFGVYNGCGTFGKFIESEEGYVRTIELEAKYLGCVCSQNAPILTTNYEFTPTDVGEYELRFKSRPSPSPSEFITVHITIN